MTNSKKQIITISGQPGSGKSTTAKNVAKALGFEHFSSGDLFRLAAKEMDQDVLTANQEAEKVDGISEIDQLVDQKLRDIGTSDNQVVIDSRTAWHWIPDSFKVLLDLDFKTAATRILSDMTPERMEAEHIPQDPSEYAQQLKERLASESRRYKSMYDINPSDPANYDLIVDTKTYGKEAAAAYIIEQFQAWQKS